MQIKEIDKQSKFYPICLKELDLNVSIKYLGNFRDEDIKTVGLVGTRECTRYGRKVVRSLVSYLSKAGITIVSGLGYGIDTCVHRSVCAVNGRSIGFLSFSFDLLHQNEAVPGVNLVKKMIDSPNHVVVSPFSQRIPPSIDTYIIRNNVLAAFCSVLIVVEAGENSNTDSIVEAALEYGKPIFAVPGSIFSEKSTGTHKMIQEGAYVLGDYKDILNYL
ncbi:DNA-processing protein DprA [Patescibacteria group bacterium]|nr:DNA-processing protein DprA [Patescibacteria group bacterium]